MEQFGQERVRHAHGHPQFECSGGGKAQFFHGCRRGVVRLDDVDSFLLEAAAGVGQCNVIVGAVHEPEPQGSFQRFELLAQGRLGDVEPGGGFAEVQFLSKDKETPELADLHGPS